MFTIRIAGNLNIYFFTQMMNELPKVEHTYFVTKYRHSLVARQTSFISGIP